jgi:hypothetical protein
MLPFGGGMQRLDRLDAKVSVAVLLAAIAG